MYKFKLDRGLFGMGLSWCGAECQPVFQSNMTALSWGNVLQNIQGKNTGKIYRKIYIGNTHEKYRFKIKYTWKDKQINTHGKYTGKKYLQTLHENIQEKNTSKIHIKKHTWKVEDSQNNIDPKRSYKAVLHRYVSDEPAAYLYNEGFFMSSDDLMCCSNKP